MHSRISHPRLESHYSLNRSFDRTLHFCVCGKKHRRFRTTVFIAIASPTTPNSSVPAEDHALGRRRAVAECDEPRRRLCAAQPHDQFRLHAVSVIARQASHG